MKNLENVFDNIYKNNTWNETGESKSGLGSTLLFTENIRNKLIDFIKEKEIKNMLDTSCGDWNWMKLIKNELCDYTGLDVVKYLVDEHNEKYSSEKIRFKHVDFLTFLKTCPDNSFDLIFCRHTLEHLHTEYNLKFLKECSRVCKYLFVTGYNDMNVHNRDLPSSVYRPINLKLKPYSDVLSEYYYGEFYDGPVHEYKSEMYMYIYCF
jgi:ubiquinone/menaquinone biosynthesis C-methylase UbiE